MLDRSPSFSAEWTLYLRDNIIDDPQALLSKYGGTGGSTVR